MAVLALLCAGCAGGPEPGEAARGPTRFAIIGAPTLGPQPAEDALLEVVTLLSLEPDLAFCLVPGPLLDPAAEEAGAARQSLTGALGSLACRVYAAAAPADGPPAELLAALEQGLSGQPSRLAYAGEAVQGLLPLVLASDGAAPTKLALQPDELPVAVAGGDPGTDRWSLIVRTGASPGITVGASGVELNLPPVAEPPHVYGLATWDGAALSVEWRQIGAGEPPQSPPPIQLTPP